MLNTCVCIEHDLFFLFSLLPLIPTEDDVPLEPTAPKDIVYVRHVPENINIQ